MSKIEVLGDFETGLTLQARLPVHLGQRTQYMVLTPEQSKQLLSLLQRIEEPTGEVREQAKS
jgi:hypothetical protein